MYQIWASELGLSSSRLIFSGVSTVDAVAQVVAHLEVEYGIRLPEAHIVFIDGESARWVLSAIDADRGRTDNGELSSCALHAAVIQHLRRGVPIHSD
jgi:hypothetical protein